MLYAIMSEDVEDSGPLRTKARDRHIERLKQLRDQGRLMLAGPHPAIDAIDPGPAGFSGSLVVAEFEGLEQAETWANDDPYVEAGAYRNVVVKPFKYVLP